MMEERKLRNDIIAVGLLAVIVFLIAALATYSNADPVANPHPVVDQFYQPDQLVYPLNEKPSNACGHLGAWVADLLIHVLGVGAYFLVIGLIALETALFKKQSVVAPWLRSAGWTLALIGSTTLASMLLPHWTVSPLIGAGGYLGALGSGILNTHVGFFGSLILAGAVMAAGLMMWTEYLVIRAGRLMVAPALVAGSKMLPFGLLHRFFKWFNGNEVEAGLSPTDLEDEFPEAEEDIPRTIRFRRRDLKDASELDEETFGEVDEEFDSEDEGEDFAEDSSEDMAAELADDGDEEDEEWDDDEETELDEEPAAEPLVKRGLKKLGIGRKKKDTEAEAEPVAEEPVEEEPPSFKVRTPEPKPKSEREVVMEELNAAAERETLKDYALPSLDILLRGQAVPFEQQKRDGLKQAALLEKCFKEFGFDVKVIEIETGPVISQFEIKLPPGLRVQKIAALADDLAIALRVPSVRIVVPIPGKNGIGIEVPNPTREVVRLRSVMEQCKDKIKKQKIPLFLGKDAVGAPLIADLAKSPHLLIAGATGTGKSVCLNAIISSILMTRRPDEVRMLMIDPKMVELSGYAQLPHLMHPVVTDMRKAEAILAWAVEKMEDRYRLLAKAGVRHLTTYNELGEEELLDRIKPENDEERQAIPSHLPFIVIVADEMADLMMTAKKEVEQHIIRLAQKSRAVGIHLILATQKPTVDVITGLIKSNLPARLAFQVASKMDSRVVLDTQGAEKLLGMGDMLYLAPGTSKPMRGQGTYLTDEEIDRLTDEVSTGEQNFVHELVNMKIKEESEEEEGPKALKNRDARYEEAVDVVVREQRGSVSLLQRAMGVGYGRAARLIDYMAEDGIVGDYSGSKAREVLIGPSRWEEMKLGGVDEAESEAEEEPLRPVSRSTVTKVAANSVAPPKRSIKVHEEEAELDDEVDDEEYEEGSDDEIYDDEAHAELDADEDGETEELEDDDEEYEYEDDEEYEDVDDDEYE